MIENDNKNIVFDMGEKNQPNCPYNIVPYTINDRPIVMSSMIDYFFHEEPLNASINLFEQNGSVIKQEVWCDTYIGNGTSFLAVSKTGDLMGVILSSTVYKEKKEECCVYEGSEYSKYNDISILLNKIQKEIDIFAKYPNVDRTLHIGAISVNDGYRRQGICKALIDKTIIVAREKGYKIIVVESSSLFTAKAVEKCGFECIYSMPYSEYVDENGEVVFKTQPPHTDIKIHVLLL